jgi:hypothetical protein
VLLVPVLWLDSGRTRQCRWWALLGHNPLHSQALIVTVRLYVLGKATPSAAPAVLDLLAGSWQLELHSKRSLCIVSQQHRVLLSAGPFCTPPEFCNSTPPWLSGTKCGKGVTFLFSCVQKRHYLSTMRQVKVCYSAWACAKHYCLLIARFQGNYVRGIRGSGDLMRVL